MSLDEYRVCEWPSCELRAAHNMHYEYESIWVCSGHQGAVIVNIESHGKIRTFRNEAITALDDEPIVRPDGGKPPKKGEKVQKQLEERDWQQEAARQAEENALPIDIVNPLLRPHRNR